MALVRSFLSLLTIQGLLAVRVKLRKTKGSLANDAGAVEGLSRGGERGHGAAEGESYLLGDRDAAVPNATVGCALPTLVALRTPAPSPDWDAIGDAVGDGVNLVEGVIDFVNDPSLQKAGQAISALGPVASLALALGGFAPPAGIVAGAALGLIGGLMSLGQGDPAPTVTLEDIQGNISEGFQKIGEQLTDITEKLSIMEDAIGVLSTQLDNLNKLISQSWMNTLTEKYQEIHRVHNTALDYIRTSHIGDLLPELHCRRFAFREYVVNDFEFSTVQRILDFVRSQPGAGSCAGVEDYRDILAARMEVASLLFMGAVLNETFGSSTSIFPLDDSIAGPHSYLEDMTRDIEQLDAFVLGRYQWTSEMLRSTAVELSSLPECQPPTPQPTPMPTPQPTPYVPSCVERDSGYGGSCQCRTNEYMQHCDDGWTYDTATCCLIPQTSPRCRRVDSGWNGQCAGLCSQNEYMWICEDGWTFDTATCCLYG